MLEVKILKPNPRPELEALRVGSRNLCYNKPFMIIHCMIKFANHRSIGKKEPTDLGSKDSAALGLNKTEDKVGNLSVVVKSFKLLQTISSCAKSVPSSAKEK